MLSLCFSLEWVEEIQHSFFLSFAQANQMAIFLITQGRISEHCQNPLNDVEVGWALRNQKKLSLCLSLGVLRISMTVQSLTP